MPRDITYCSVTPKDVDEIINKTLLEGSLVKATVPGSGY